MWGNIKVIIEEQYLLARKCHIGIEESNRMADFERQIFINMIIKELEEEAKAYNKGSKK
jgi:hypothetical protein